MAVLTVTEHCECEELMDYLKRTSIIQEGQALFRELIRDRVGKVQGEKTAEAVSNSCRSTKAWPQGSRSFCASGCAFHLILPLRNAQKGVIQEIGSADSNDENGTKI
jgi:hypothetical protein